MLKGRPNIIYIWSLIKCSINNDKWQNSKYKNYSLCYDELFDDFFDYFFLLANITGTHMYKQQQTLILCH